MANVNLNPSKSSSRAIHQLHQAVDEVEKSQQKGQKSKYIQIKQGMITVTTNKKEKASFKDIAQLITSLKDEALKKQGDLIEYVETVEKFKKIAKSQSDIGELSRAIFGTPKSEKAIHELNTDAIEQEYMMQLLKKPDKSEDELHYILAHSKIRIYSLSTLKPEQKEKIAKAKALGLTESEATAIVIYSTDAYRLLNAYLRGQQDVFEKGIKLMNRWLEDPVISSIDEHLVEVEPKPAIGSQKEVENLFKEESRMITDLIESGLSKLPIYTGSVYRGDLLTEVKTRSNKVEKALHVVLAEA